MSEGDERFVSLSEVKKMLEDADKAREELTYEQKLALEHARRFARFSAPDAKKLVKELQAIEKVDSAMALRLVDLAPTDAEDITALFAKSRITLEGPELQNILETVAKFLPE